MEPKIICDRIFNMSVTEIILASASPRRRQILSWAIADFICKSADIDETPGMEEEPVLYCERMALEKANVLAGFHPLQEKFILASDTTVFRGHQIYGKPADAADAFRMLKELQGKPHSVCTAVAVLHANGTKQEKVLSCCQTTVQMRPMTDIEIENYVASGDPEGKAGAYAIQNLVFQPVAAIEGCYACVMGLPLCHTELLFSLSGMPIENDFSACCKAHIAFPCNLKKEAIQKNAVVKRIESELSV